MGNWRTRLVPQDASRSNIVAEFDEPRLIQGQTSIETGRIADRPKAIPLRRDASRPSGGIAGGKPAAQSSRSDSRAKREPRHEVSILVAAGIGVVGRWRGVRPASNVSMITIRAPQQGQGCVGFSVASGPADA